MESMIFLDEYEKILSATPLTQEMFEDRLAWIDSRRTNWGDNRIRMGVIGDTSCGKSTLINAILGMDILSSAVAPSSGILVNCCYGKETAVTVRFQDGKKIVFKGKDIKKEKIQNFSDERFNRHNEKNVSIIELQTPNFKFDRDVILIDSPGLNAYGLEAHEKITLVTMLPTIDICMYLTTTKATSDENTRDVLNAVSRNNKPILIVQNKLDAVEASPGGGKSKEQVAEEHYKRVQRIVEKSSIKDKESVDIVQVSAINALKWRMAQTSGSKSKVSKQDYIDSRFDEFIQTVSRRIQNFRPCLEASRIKSIYRSIHEIITEIEERIDGIEITGPNSKSCNYDVKISELNDFIGNNTERVATTAREIDENFNNLISEVEREITEEKINAYISRTNQLIKKNGDDLYNYISEINNDLGRYCQYVNLPVRDIFVTPQISDSKTLEEIEFVRQKKKGFRAAVSRIFNIFSKDKDIGYEYVPKNDLLQTKNDILALLKEEKDRYQLIIYSWNETCIQNCKDIKDLLLSEKRCYEKRQNAEIQKNELQRIQDELYNLEKNVKGQIKETQKWKAHKTEFTEKKVNVEVGPITNEIVDLAENLKKRQNNHVMRRFIKMKQLENHFPILLGWDEDCEKRFIWNSGIEDTKIIHLLKEEAPKEGDGIDTIFFVLVNSSQIGKEKKRVKDLKLSNIVETNDYLIWVVQDFEELLNSDSVEDGLKDMLSLKNFSEIESESIVWISHDNPIYNIAFLEQQIHPKQNIAEEQAGIDEIRKYFSLYCDEEEIETVAEILKVRDNHGICC